MSFYYIYSCLLLLKLWYVDLLRCDHCKRNKPIHLVCFAERNKAYKHLGLWEKFSYLHLPSLLLLSSVHLYALPYTCKSSQLHWHGSSLPFSSVRSFLYSSLFIQPHATASSPLPTPRWKMPVTWRYLLWIVLTAIETTETDSHLV